WNKIEHRMFCHITQNWRATPLLSLLIVIELIANTTTKTGLKIRCELDSNTYPKGIKVSDAEMATLNHDPRLIPSRMELQNLAEVSRNEAIVFGHRLSARCAQRVTQRDRAAIDVKLGRVASDRLQPGERDGRERLVHFVNIDIPDRHTGSLQRPARGADRFFQHNDGIAGIRERQGRPERVIVVDDGFAWNGATYASLSALAFASAGSGAQVGELDDPSQ